MTAPPDFAFGSGHKPGLAKLAEESGELATACCKYVALFRNPAHALGDLESDIHDEAGDVMAALVFAMARGWLDRELVMERMHEKLERFERWHSDDTGGYKP